jgi:hypothetical protein
MNKAMLFALFCAGLLVGTIGVIYAAQATEASNPVSEEPLFVG